jgi:hypothetical protein
VKPPEEEDKVFESAKDNKIDYIKVIRTPVSSRTFVIGGKTNKTVREIIKR